MARESVTDRPQLVIAKHDRWHRFVLRRTLDARGLHLYELENTARKEKLTVPLDLFDRFRALVAEIRDEIENTDEKKVLLELRFSGRTRFSLQWARANPESILIRAYGPDELPAADLVVAPNALAPLLATLHHTKLRHPNDLLVRIVTYHRLFAATFTESTESITSNLQLRRGLLSHVERYVPALARKTRVPEEPDSDLVEPAMLKQFAPTKAAAATTRTFRSRLGERDQDKQYQVDYESLFVDPGSGPAAPAGRRAKSRAKLETPPPDEPVNYFPVPLLAADVKKFAKVPFRCMLSREDVKQLRTSFLDDRDATFYLGFEIFDAIFEKRSKLQTNRFPLYYLPIRIVESGREAILHPLEEERVYLNHFALANLVETYSSSGQAAKRLDDFLSALLSHQFTVRGVPDRIRLLRWLPCGNDVFDRTREILLGLPGENGKGGLLADVKVRAIECDLESVFLYKAPQSSSPITRALHDDLSQILAKNDAAPDMFHSSLLARSLSPQTQATEATDSFSETLSMHGPQARSIRTLTERLNAHDLVMLEGPPGTGKTYNIANLLIHCVATGKRLLVVSDQEAAIHALTEQIQRYVVDGHPDTAEGRELDQLWRMGIKVVDELPTGAATLSSWARQVRRMLGVDASKELDWPSPVSGYDAQVARIDQKIRQVVEAIDEVMTRRFGNDHHWRLPTVSARSEHPETPDAIDEALRSVAHLTSNEAMLDVLRNHVGYRERLIEFGLHDSYDLFNLEGRADVAEPRLNSVQVWLQQLDEAAPVSIEDFDRVEPGEAAHALRSVLRKRWVEAFPPNQSWTNRAASFISSLWGQHELHRLVLELSTMVAAQQGLWESKDTIDPELWDALSRLHLALAPSGGKPLDVRLELLLTAGRNDSDSESIQEQLEAVATLQKERDRLVRQQFLHGLGAIGRQAFQASKRGGTNRLTSILATLDRLESAASWARAHDAVRELQELLFEVFPIWISRKQAVPFLLPCREQTFDLVIVDEATQCRVDDAIPLLFRGRKLMAVGDERQTVLAKNSAIDDYLFDDFELDEHLRFAQARGMKGGGSHLFGLVKRIKQASVMLDEHYRCPPDIIEFSNRYVYGNQLRTMQWTMAGSPPTVVVDHTEANRDSSDRQQTGKFKGIETDMIDRFMAYTARILRKIERDTGEEINPDTDVALVYFLLKNEPYIKEAKGQLLKKLYRGSDVLDGAGAALQGKERNYIFYLWDITRYNMANFRQGDDESKRKGELNVLMSRPKKRAYHFLHRDFAKLKHHSATITDYLWRTFQAQSKTRKKRAADGSGELLCHLVTISLGEHGPHDEDVQLNVTLGNPMYGVDVMWLAPEERRLELPSIGLVDLGVFMTVREPGQEVVDYFFQLQRAIPSVAPVFGFMHEFADPSSAVVDRIKALSHRR